jgi:hypothetical protein
MRTSKAVWVAAVLSIAGASGVGAVGVYFAGFRTHQPLRTVARDARAAAREARNNTWAPAAYRKRKIERPTTEEPWGDADSGTMDCPSGPTIDAFYRSWCGAPAAPRESPFEGSGYGGNSEFDDAGGGPLL